MLHVNWKNGETRQRFSLSLSLSLVQEGPGKYRVHARERLRDYYTVPTFPPMRNADIRKITRLALPRHATKRGFPGATEFPPSFDQGGQRRGGGEAAMGTNASKFQKRIRASAATTATRHLRSTAITSLSSRVSQSSLKGS